LFGQALTDASITLIYWRSEIVVYAVLAVEQFD
jgi:hypothetical protein